MDGVHDLGGKEGFGPVPWHADQGGEAFHEEWEGRAWGIFSGMGGHPSWTVDWFRHARERIEPTLYLTSPYFDHWVWTIMAMLVDDEIADKDELLTGRARFETKTETYPGMAPSEVLASLAHLDRHKADVQAGPTFAIGDGVRAKSSSHSHHTRLPAYVRGRTGIVEDYLGGRVLADANAQGDHRGEHLYTVYFKAADLWPEAKGRTDRVYLDLWESYLEHP